MFVFVRIIIIVNLLIVLYIYTFYRVPLFRLKVQTHDWRRSKIHCPSIRRSASRRKLFSR